MEKSYIRLHNIDCMDFMASVPDKSYQLSVVDPPYFSGPNKLGYYGDHTVCSRTGVFRTGYKRVGKWDPPDQRYFDELRRVSVNQIIWGINYYDFTGVGPGRIVWDKVNDSSTFSDCEIAFCSLIKGVKIFRFMWNGMMQGKSALEGHITQGNKKLNEKRIHPTQKPVALYKWILQNYAKPGDKILETHGGSGTIAIACYDMGLDLDLCELDPQYFAAGKARVERHMAQERLFIRT